MELRDRIGALKRNPWILPEIARSPVAAEPLVKHIWTAYESLAGSRSGGRRVLSAVWRGVRGKVGAERILRSWPPFRPDPTRIIIDVTHNCNLGCTDCNRSCGLEQANSPHEHMSVAQIERFVSESLEQRRRWVLITVEGGEPTTNPDMLESMDVLVRYKRQHSPDTTIVLATNGHAPGAHAVIEQLPPEVSVNNSSKETVEQGHHMNFNMAPIDVCRQVSGCFRNGCLLPVLYGIGLNRHGYYPHPVCGGIDRVFGRDVGRKSLPRVDDAMLDMHEPLCRYCGHFYDSNGLPAPGEGLKPGDMSASWKEAYADYEKARPQLTLY